MKDIDKLDIRDGQGGAVIAVKAAAGAAREGIVGVLGDRLKIATSAPPEKGRANAGVARILARALGVKKSAVKLAAGQSSPRKEFHVAGLLPLQVRQRLQRHRP